LKNVREIQEWELDYYDDEDVFDLSEQHGCYKKFFLRKGAKKSKEKMLRVINEKIENTRKEIEGLIWDIERFAETKTKIENNDLDVYL